MGLQLLGLQLCYELPSFFTLLLADEASFRSLIVWLEDQKIRHYTIEGRAALRQVSDDATWPDAFSKVSEHNVKRVILLRPINASLNLNLLFTAVELLNCVVGTISLLLVFI